MTELSREYQDRARERSLRSSARDSFLYLGDQLKARNNSDAADLLLGAIEGEILPRLMLTHSDNDGVSPKSSESSLLTEADHSEFLRLVRGESAASTRRFVSGLISRGVRRRDILLDLMPRAARTLGTLWEEDLCDFAEVTIGLCRLHEVLRDQSRLSEPLRMHAANDAPQILFGTACGDQHIFGVLVAAECFRRDGWRVWSEPATAPEDLAELVAKVAFDVVALSVTCGSYKERLVGEIAVLRRSSCEPDVKVVIGGRLFAEQPELGEALGADAFLGDVETAPREARKLLAEARVDC